MEPRSDHGEDSYRGTGLLEGKSAIIAGADSGIGRAVAIAFAREGFGANAVFKRPAQPAELAPISCVSRVRRAELRYRANLRDHGRTNADLSGSVARAEDPGAGEVIAEDQCDHNTKP